LSKLFIAFRFYDFMLDYLTYKTWKGIQYCWYGKVNYAAYDKTGIKFIDEDLYFKEKI